MFEIYASNNGHTFETRGLKGQCGYELSATVSDIVLGEDCHEFIRFIADYILSGHAIRSEETVAYGYWLTKAILSDDQRLIFHEYNPEATDFIFGIDNTISYWRVQHDLCSRVGAEFAPPRPDQMIVISEGVYEGDPVEGVRYPSPPHMSGWWLTTDRYNDDINSLKTVHSHHVTEKRPDLVRFLALPSGYRFFSTEGNVWFDEEAAKEE